MTIYRRLLTKCTCGSLNWERCSCPRNKFWSLRYDRDGKPVERVLRGITRREDAARIMAAEGRLHSDSDRKAWFSFMDGRKLRNTYATVGAIVKSYLGAAIALVAKETSARNVQSLRLVLAHALGLWRQHEGGIRGVRIGDRVPDEGKIAALPASVLTKDLVRKYQAARLGAETVDLRAARQGNSSINSTLSQARGVFSKDAMLEKLAELRLPDLAGFLKARLLPQVAGGPEPIGVELFARVYEAWSALVPSADHELYLCQWLLRQTGLRTEYVLSLRGSWLREAAGGGWELDVRARPEEGFALKPKTSPQRVPLAGELAEVLLARREQHGPAACVLLPRGSITARTELVRRRHNAWLKNIIGGRGQMCQGNHRLRDTVASVCRALWGLDVAQMALGHSSPMTTAKHYAQLDFRVSELMRADLAAWARMSGRVVPFSPPAPAAAAAVTARALGDMCR